MEQMMYTFLFRYDAHGTEDEIEFCAPDFREARELFWEWIREEYWHSWRDVILTDVRAVFNEADAWIYNTRYGDPGDFRGYGFTLDPISEI